MAEEGELDSNNDGVINEDDSIGLRSQGKAKVEATATLTVGSNPTGVDITVTPNDVNGDGNGTTPFTRVYTVGTEVCLTAPMMQGPKMFLRWELDDEQLPFGKTKATITMDEDHSVEAIYQCLENDFENTLDCAIKMIMDCFAECEPAQVENKDNGPSGKEIVECLKLLTNAAHDNINRKCIRAIGQASGDMTVANLGLDAADTNHWNSDRLFYGFGEVHKAAGFVHQRCLGERDGIGDIAIGTDIDGVGPGLFT